LNVLSDGGEIRNVSLFFGGMVVPYHVERLLMSRISTEMYVEKLARPDDVGWDDALTMLYYREQLGHQHDPMEAEALLDHYWRRHRSTVFLKDADTVARLSAILIVPFLVVRNDSPVDRLRSCLNCPHTFRVFRVDWLCK